MGGCLASLPCMPSSCSYMPNPTLKHTLCTFCFLTWKIGLAGSWQAGACAMQAWAFFKRGLTLNFGVDVGGGFWDSVWLHSPSMPACLPVSGCFSLPQTRQTGTHARHAFIACHQPLFLKSFPLRAQLQETGLLGAPPCLHSRSNSSLPLHRLVCLYSSPWVQHAAHLWGPLKEPVCLVWGRTLPAAAFWGFLAVLHFTWLRRQKGWTFLI